MRSTLLVLVLAATSVMADTEVHRCLLEDGTFAFQETPCPALAAGADDVRESDTTLRDSETPASDDDESHFVNPFDEPARPPATVEPVLHERLSKDRAECEKTTRDAIDGIDVEMRETGYSEEQGRQYLAQLLELTRQLRACKQL